MRWSASRPSSSWSDGAAMEERSRMEQELRAAAEALAAKGLMREGDMLALRAPAQGEAATLALSRDGAEVSWAGLDDRAGGDPEMIFSARPDVGAVLVGGPDWARGLSLLDHAMPGVFDEQIRHLGKQVARLPRRVDAADLKRLLGTGANGFLHDGRLWCFGMTLERLAQNAEILEKCAKAYMLAAMTGERVRRIPWLVRHIANGRLLADEKLAAAAHSRGERAIPKAGY